jgi:hypothetical protein
MIAAALLLWLSGPAVILPAGTPVRLATVGEIHSKSIRQGQRLALTVTEDVKVGDRLLIARGTPAVGEIESVSDTGMMGKAGKFSLVPLFVELPGRRVNLVGEQQTRGKRQVGAAAVTSVITTFGIFITGKSAILPAGSPLVGEVRTDVEVPVAGPMASNPAIK